MKPTEDVFEDALEALICNALDDDDSFELPGKLRRILVHFVASERVDYLFSRRNEKGDPRGNEP